MQSTRRFESQWQSLSPAAQSLILMFAASPVWKMYGFRYDQRQAPSDEQMSAVVSSHAKVQPRLESGGWLRLDHRELAACALAVSHAKRLVRKKHAAQWTTDYNRAARRLHKHIEKHRKRAIKLLPAALHKPERQRILADLCVVRQRLAPNVQEGKQNPWVRMRARELVDRAERLALSGLQIRGFEAPTNRGSVRVLVRTYMRNVVRRGFGRQMCLEDEFSARLTLADYVIKHSDHLVRRPMPIDDGPPCVRATSFLPSDVASPFAGEAETSPLAALRNEVPAALRIACSELEWLMTEDLDWKSDWSKLSRFAQAAAVAKAKKGGLSNRHISRIIGVDDKTVARMLKEARLSKAVRTEVVRGNKSVNQALKEATDPVYQQNERLEREERDGSVSDDLAEKVVAYVLERDSVSWVARQIVRRAKELAADESSEWLRKQVPEVDVDQAMAASRVQVNGEPEHLDIETAATRLVWWLVRIAPEVTIHSVALDKALRRLPNYACWGTKA